MFEKILLAVDGSEHSEKAIPIAGDLGRRYSAEVVVLHVREHELARGGGVDIETPQDAMDLVDRVVRRLKDDGTSVRGEVVRVPLGQISRAILDLCKEEDADLIIMGTRGLSDWGRLLMGSVAHKIVHLAEVPVLIVR